MTFENYIAHCTKLVSQLKTGPWNNEPHFYRFKYLGINCAIVRQPTLLIYCGYVGVYEAHPWFGLSHDRINADCHGGLTYAEGKLSGHYGLEPDAEPMWWVGFDCAHCDDLIPILLAYQWPNPQPQKHYRDFNYVMESTKALASQARKASNRKWGDKRA